MKKMYTQHIYTIEICIDNHSNPSSTYNSCTLFCCAAQVVDLFPAAIPDATMESPAAFIPKSCGWKQWPTTTSAGFDSMKSSEALALRPQARHEDARLVGPLHRSIPHLPRHPAHSRCSTSSIHAAARWTYRTRTARWSSGYLCLYEAREAGRQPIGRRPHTQRPSFRLIFMRRPGRSPARTQRQTGLRGTISVTRTLHLHGTHDSTQCSGSPCQS